MIDKEYLHDTIPHRHDLQALGVPKDKESITSPAAGDIDPIIGSHKTWRVFSIAAHSRKNNYLCFLSLEVISDRN